MLVVNDAARARIKDDEDRKIYIHLNILEVVRNFQEKMIVKK